LALSGSLSIMIRCLIIALFVLTSCALPRAHREFSVKDSGSGDQSGEFASSKDLLVSGLVSEGLALSQGGRFLEAEGRLRQARYLEPANDRISFNLAVIINQSGQSEESLAILTRLLSNEPQNPNYLQGIADANLSLRNYDKTREYLKEAFELVKGVGNNARAAVLARSISNVAFGAGYEQEALCYSYEAVTLGPSPVQYATHARLLVALNLFSQAETFLKSKSGALNEPLANHVVALARYGQGNFRGALEAEEGALGRISQAPELSQEVTVAWWLMKAKLPDDKRDDVGQERERELRDNVIQFGQKQGYELVMWPAALRRELVRLRG